MQTRLAVSRQQDAALNEQLAGARAEATLAAEQVRQTCGKRGNTKARPEAKEGRARRAAPRRAAPRLRIAREARSARLALAP